MEAGTTPTTGSKTIADLLPKAAEIYADKPAIRHKVDGEWQDVSFSELGGIVSEIGRGLLEMGLEPGERVSILCSTRPEWVYHSFAVSAAGGVVVPIYATNSPRSASGSPGTPSRRRSSSRTPSSSPRSPRSVTGSPTCASSSSSTRPARPATR